MIDKDENDYDDIDGNYDDDEEVVTLIYYCHFTLKTLNIAQRTSMNTQNNYY